MDENSKRRWSHYVSDDLIVEFNEAHAEFQPPVTKGWFLEHLVRLGLQQLARAESLNDGTVVSAKYGEQNFTLVEEPESTGVAPE